MYVYPHVCKHRFLLASIDDDTQHTVDRIVCATFLTERSHVFVGCLIYPVLCFLIGLWIFTKISWEICAGGHLKGVSKSEGGGRV